MQRIIEPPFRCRLPQSMAEALEMYGDSYSIPKAVKNCIRHDLKTWTDWAAWQARRNVQQHYGRMRQAFWTRRTQKQRGLSAAAAEADIRRLMTEFARSRWERAFWAEMVRQARQAEREFEAAAPVVDRVMPAAVPPLPTRIEEAA